MTKYQKLLKNIRKKTEKLSKAYYEQRKAVNEMLTYQHKKQQEELNCPYKVEPQCSELERMKMGDFTQEEINFLTSGLHYNDVPDVFKEAFNE